MQKQLKYIKNILPIKQPQNKRGIVKGSTLTKPSQAEIDRHPLATFEPRNIGSWAEWRQLWDRATTIQELEGLLHCGFNVEDRAASAERLCFYLEVANLHSAGFYPAEETGAVFRNEARNRRQNLAHKAFGVLAVRFFKVCGSSGFIWIGETPVVLEKLLWFFRLEGSKLPNFVSSNHAHSQHTKEFLLALCRYGWGNASDRYTMSSAAIAAFRRVQPRFIEILYGIGELNVLTGTGLIEYKLSQACWRKLEQLVMSERITKSWGFNQYDIGKPESVAEAAAFGSKAATTLLQLQNRRDQIERLRREHPAA